MILLIEDKVPHIEISYPAWSERFKKNHILKAYEDLTTAYRGVHDFVNVIDCIGEEIYSMEEAIIAGVFITDALDGYFIKGGFREKAKYMRINGYDAVLTAYSHWIFTENELKGCRFDGDNGKRYSLSTMKIKDEDYKMSLEIYAESSHANDRSPEDE